MVDSDNDEGAQTPQEPVRPLTAAEARARGAVPRRPAKKAVEPAKEQPAPAEPLRPADVAPRRTPVKRAVEPDTVAADKPAVAAEPVKAPRKRVAKQLPTPPVAAPVPSAPVVKPEPEPMVPHLRVASETAPAEAPAARPAPRPAPVVQEPVPGVPITKTHVAGVAAVLLLLLRRRRRRRG